jgi:cytochrome bd-type quinol oxidase subunit 2
MNAGKGYLKITIVASLVPVIVGMLMFTLSRAADEKAVGLATAVICPAAIWAVYGCAFFPFKGFLSS